MPKGRVNTYRKGQYYLAKTIAWLESQGYDVGRLEATRTMKRGREHVFKRNDVFGCDLAAKSSDHIVFIQSKSRRSDALSSAKELSKMTWPPQVSVYATYWEPYVRFDRGPVFLLAAGVEATDAEGTSLRQQ